MVVTYIQNDPLHLSSLLSSHYHVLFDCDGLILDTEPIYSTVALVAIRHLLLQHNKPFNDDSEDFLFPRSVKFKVMGGTSDQVSLKMANYLASTHDIPVTPADWSYLVAPLESHNFALGCPLMPFVRETIDLFKQKGWPMAVATSSARQTFLIKSQAHTDLFANFPVITCGDDPDYSSEIEIDAGTCTTDPSNKRPNDIYTSNKRPLVKGKPHPSIFHTARHHLNLSPSHPGLVLEDSPNGVVAALRSGHSCIWVPAEDAPPGFQLIDNVLKEFEGEIPKNSDLWVYRASSLKELHFI